MADKTETATKYDVSVGIAEARKYMRLAGPVSLEVHRIAEDYARSLRDHFEGRDLLIVAESMIVSSGSLGVLVDSQMSIAALNMQAVAAVLIIDSLADQDLPQVTA